MFGTRWVLVLFGILAVSSIFSGLNHDASAGKIALTFFTMLFLGAAITGFCMVWGWLVAINTIYTITDKRLIIRHGVTMPMAINVPYAKVATAAAKVREDGSGDVSVAMLDGNNVSLFAIWPHNRPWNWQGVAPAMRAIPDAARVGVILHDALVAHVTEHGDVYEGARPKMQIRTRDREIGARMPSAPTAAQA
jgi:uncharacterized protein with PQ loop repeat